MAPGDSLRRRSRNAVASGQAWGVTRTPPEDSGSEATGTESGDPTPGRAAEGAERGAGRPADESREAAYRELPESWADDLAESVGLSKARYDRATVLSKAKMQNVDTRKWWRAMGLVEVPDDVVAFGREDLAMVRALRLVMQQDDKGEEHLFRLARLLGGSFSRIAEAQTKVLDDMLTQVLDEDLDTPAERAAALSSAEAESLLDLLDQSMTYVWRRHLFAALGRWIGADPDEDTRAVGFMDISGFSQLSKRLEPQVLADVVERFESEAIDVVAHHGGRVVKFIGDEAFFVVEDIPSAVDVALEVADRMAADEPSVALHTGIAMGATVTIAGDVFGNTVNLAKRLTDAARKGRIVLPRADAEALSEREDLMVRRVARSLDLKGVGRTAAVSVSRRKSAD